MTVKELFKNVTREEISKACDNGYSVEKKYKEALLKAYDSIKKLVPAERDEDDSVTHVLTELVMDDFFEDNCPEEDLYYYGLTGFNAKAKDGVNYGLEFTSWNKILNYEVWENSILAFGKVNCVISLLYEMSFLGCDEEMHSENVAKELNILDERQKDAEEHPENLIPIDNLFKELGFEDTRTEEEKDKDNQKMDDVCKINLLHKLGLLGYDFFSDDKHSFHLEQSQIDEISKLVISGVKGYDLLNKCKELSPNNEFLENNLFKRNK